MAYRTLPSSLLGNPIHNEPLQIIGGGIAGLMAGITLQERGIDVRVYEKQSQAGGLIQTRSTGYGQVEGAANGFLWCAEMQQLADWVGATVVKPGAGANARYIVRNGKLKRFPLYNWEVLRLLGRLLVPHRGPFTTVAEFGEAYLGRTATYEVLAPALGGIYGADITQLSFPAALPMLARALDNSSWLPLGFWRYKGQQPKQPSSARKGTHSFKGGMGAFVSAMVNHLGEQIQLNTDGLEVVDRQAPVMITAPAYVAARYFGDHPIADLLRATPYTPITSVKLVFAATAIPGYRPGFGCLIPRSEGKALLGILFNHDIFPDQTEEGYFSFTAIMRDDPFASEMPIQQQTDTALVDLVCREMNDLIPLEDKPIYTHVDRYSQGIPLYTPAHFTNLFDIDNLLRTDFPNVRLFGNYTGEISVRGMAQMAIRMLVPA